VKEQRTPLGLVMETGEAPPILILERAPLMVTVRVTFVGLVLVQFAILLVGVHCVSPLSHLAVSTLQVRGANSGDKSVNPSLSVKKAPSDVRKLLIWGGSCNIRFCIDKRL
jgi:hypothetical protein